MSTDHTQQARDALQTPDTQPAPDAQQGAGARRRRRFRVRGQLSNLVLLTLTWMLLNSSASVLTILLGFALALLITWVFPLPTIEWRGHLRPLGFVWLVVKLLADLAVASTRLAVTAFSPRPHPQSAVIAVRLNSDGDLYQVGTASVLAIVPGSVVVDARRKTRTLYLHIFDTTAEALDQVKRDALKAEGRILGAFASSAELREARERGRQS